MFIDTHCHVNMIVKKEFDKSLSTDELKQGKIILEQARAYNVSRIINVGTSFIESRNVIELANQYDAFYATVGIHPTDAQHATLSDITSMKKWFLAPGSEKIVGVGECGFDFYHHGLSKQKQEDFFVAQIELALEYNRAVVVHSRNAYDETLAVLERYKENNMRAVVHCFSYDQQFADIVISWGFYLGIGGTITYPKNEQLRSIVKACDLSFIVLETDAPFLPIQSMRGKINHPKHIRQIAEYVAELKGVSVEEVGTVATKNSFELFHME